jgi:uncharacterized protein (TIGR03437 family)
MISVYGKRLTEGLTEQASTVPLPERLAGAQAILAGHPLPLLFASPGQINAIVPLELNLNTTHQLLARRGSTYSRPVSVSVAPAQPATFLAGGRPVVIAVRGDLEFLVNVRRTDT